MARRLVTSSRVKIDKEGTFNLNVKARDLKSSLYFPCFMNYPHLLSPGCPGLPLPWDLRDSSSQSLCNASSLESLASRQLCQGGGNNALGVSLDLQFPFSTVKSPFQWMFLGWCCLFLPVVGHRQIILTSGVSNWLEYFFLLFLIFVCSQVLWSLMV